VFDDRCEEGRTYHVGVSIDHRSEELALGIEPNACFREPSNPLQWTSGHLERVFGTGEPLLILGGHHREEHGLLAFEVTVERARVQSGFPSDLTSIALVLATQAQGTVLIHEKMFENRLFFVDRLIAMGARVILCDPHRAIVTGPTPLQGETLASPDIRAGMALVAAALAANGRSVIMNAHQVDRGYEHIDARLRDLGASIVRT